MPQQSDVRVCLHRVANLQIQSGKAFGKTAVVIRHGFGTVNVGGCAVKSCNFSKIDRLAVEVGTDVVEVVHNERKEKNLSKD